MIRMQKYEIFCSRNTSIELHATVVQVLGVRQVLGTSKYIGLPSMICWSKKATFKYVKYPIWNRLGS